MEDSLLSKLFIARILTSTVFSFLSLNWGDFLNPNVISSIISIQISASFTAPIINFLDIYGFINRHIMSRLFPANNQMESNEKYFGATSWSLAERYTSLSKVLYIALLYSLLTPYSLFISAIACLLTFLLDRFLLLRRWSKVPMMDATLANRFRQQVLFALCVHMYLSLIFIYGWPFDNVYVVSNTNNINKYEKVNKDSPLWIFYIDVQYWQSNGVKHWLIIYKITTIIIILITLYVIFGDRILLIFRHLFCTIDNNIGNATK